MVTAGRTVLFSALTVALSMAAMVLFPMYFLQSFAYAGVAVVAFAAIGGDRGHPRRHRAARRPAGLIGRASSGRRVLRRPEPEHKPVEQLFWYRSTKFVMRRAFRRVAVVGLLLLFGCHSSR